MKVLNSTNETANFVEFLVFIGIEKKRESKRMFL